MWSISFPINKARFLLPQLKLPRQSPLQIPILATIFSNHFSTSLTGRSTTAFPGCKAVHFKDMTANIYESGIELIRKDPQAIRCSKTKDCYHAIGKTGRFGPTSCQTGKRLEIWPLNTHFRLIHPMAADCLRIIFHILHSGLSEFIRHIVMTWQGECLVKASLAGQGATSERHSPLPICHPFRVSTTTSAAMHLVVRCGRLDSAEDFRL